MIVILGNKIGGIYICVNFEGHNEAYVHYLFPMLFSDEILDKFARNGPYSFNHQILMVDDKKMNTFPI